MQPTPPPILSSPRHALLLLVALLLPACGAFGIGMTDEEEQALAGYQSRAQLYWESEKLEQCLQQVQKGKELAPDDYKLNTIEAWIYLRASLSNPKALDQAVERFDAVMSWRSPSAHSPQVLRGRASAYQQLGQRARREAVRLAEMVEKSGGEDPQVAEWVARRSEYATRAQAHFRTAMRTVQHLLDKGESLMEAHQLAMHLSEALRDYNACFRHGDAYLDLSRIAQEQKQLEIRRTQVLGYEAEKRKELRQLKIEERMVREYLANTYFDRGLYDDAIRHLNQVLAMDPDRSETYYNRARCYQELGRTELMKRDYQSFLVKSDLPEGSPLRSQARLALGQP